MTRLFSSLKSEKTAHEKEKNQREREKALL